jgi:hypothetical protein
MFLDVEVVATLQLLQQQKNSTIETAINLEATLN